MEKEREGDIVYKCDQCNDVLLFKIVKKEGPNKGREFSKCNKCNKFYWKDTKYYKRDQEKYKIGSCYRCGYYGCDLIDCKKQFDWFGNLIPDDDDV